MDSTTFSNSRVSSHAIPLSHPHRLLSPRFPIHLPFKRLGFNRNRLIVSCTSDSGDSASLNGIQFTPNKLFVHEAIGAEYGEGFETFRVDRPLKVDVDYLNDNLQEGILQCIRYAVKPDEAYGLIFCRDNVVVIYKIKLPGPAILGEGKPENQNHAIIFTRGEGLQTIDMNQDNYMEEALKMRNLLQEFLKKHDGVRFPSILGLREHIFTGSVSSFAWFMSNQETSFVTIGQRLLANPLSSSSIFMTDVGC